MTLQTPACAQCGTRLQQSILFGDLRFYVCQPCQSWAVPYPPAPSARSASAPRAAAVKR